MKCNDEYYSKFILNYSLNNLPGEQWKTIEDNDNYAVSNYGRVKSLERWLEMGQGRTKKLPEIIMKLFLSKRFNKHLNQFVYHVFCRLSKHGIKRNISVSRLVYYYFVEQFDMQNNSIIISHKDNNSLHLHFSNLELLTISEQKNKMFRNKRAQSWKSAYKAPICQYNMQGEFIKRYESIYDAEKQTGINSGSIYTVIHGHSLTASGFRWFPAHYRPTDKDFRVIAQNKMETKDDVLNLALWKKLAQPVIDSENPPPYLNMSLKNLPDEMWKPIPGFEGLYEVSNKGRVKKLAGWTSHINRIFLGEQILGLRFNETRGRYLDVCLTKNKKKTCVSITRLVYYCFVETFNLKDRSFVVACRDKNFKHVTPNNLELRSLGTVLHEAKSRVSF